MQVKSIGVVGAGTMGNGIAQVCAASGYQVVMRDVSDEALERGMRAIEKSLDRMVAKDRITAEAKKNTLARIQPATDFGLLAKGDVAIEAVSEDVELKLSIFRQLEEICGADTILATNTSSISITKIAGAIQLPERVIGMHFMNPVPVMKLVEIVRAIQTSDATHAMIVELASNLGKTPVTVRDSLGFISNRLLVPMINEAIYCLYEGLAVREDIDTVMRLGMNHPMGPLALADLIGLDICLAIMEVLHEGFSDSKYRPCPLLRQMVDAGHLGRKTGRGFYEYG